MNALKKAFVTLISASLVLLPTSPIFAQEGIKFDLAPAPGVIATVEGEGFDTIFNDNVNGQQGAISFYPLADTTILVTQQVVTYPYANTCHVQVNADGSWQTVPTGEDHCQFLAESGTDSVIAPGNSTQSPQAPDDPSQVDQWDEALAKAFTGVQVNVRKPTGYGLYVVKAQINTEVQPTVTGLFTFAPQPAPSAYPKLNDLWRWSEIDWEFVPHTVSSAKEQINCQGSFPNATCTDLRSNGLGENELVNWTDPNGVDKSATLDYSFLTVNGTYDNDTIAKAIGIVGEHPRIINWKTLVNNTKPGGIYETGTEWGFPRTMPLPPFIAKDGSKQDLYHSVALNIFRMPEGTREVDYTNPASGETVTGKFIPAKSFYGYKPAMERLDRAIGDVGTSSGSSNVSADSYQTPGFSITNQLYTINPDYNPYNSFHTYTMAWLPDQVAFYIDAPNGGLDIQNATPVKVMKASEYPGLSMMGPNMPGGDIPWIQTGGQQTLDNKQMFQLGQVHFMFNMWMNSMWGGMPKNNDEFKTTDTLLREVAVYPVNKKVYQENSGRKLRKADFVTNKNNANVFYTDFSKWKLNDWRTDFRKNFIAEQANDNTKSILNVKLGRAYDGYNALILTIRNQEELKEIGQNQYIYQLSPGVNSKAVLSKLDDDSAIYAQAINQEASEADDIDGKHLERYDVLTVEKQTDMKLTVYAMDREHQGVNRVCYVRLSTDGGVTLLDENGNIDENASCPVLTPSQGGMDVSNFPYTVTLAITSPAASSGDPAGYYQLSVGGIDPNYTAVVKNDTGSITYANAEGGSPAQTLVPQPSQDEVLQVVQTGPVFNDVSQIATNVCHIVITENSYKKAPQSGDLCQFIAETGSGVISTAPVIMQQTETPDAAQTFQLAADGITVLVTDIEGNTLYEVDDIDDKGAHSFGLSEDPQLLVITASKDGLSNTCHVTADGGQAIVTADENDHCQFLNIFNDQDPTLMTVAPNLVQ